jgi:hypothetical protein
LVLPKKFIFRAAGGSRRKVTRDWWQGKRAC